MLSSKYWKAVNNHSGWIPSTTAAGNSNNNSTTNSRMNKLVKYKRGSNASNELKDAASAAVAASIKISNNSGM